MSKRTPGNGQKAASMSTKEQYDRILGMGQGFNPSGDDLLHDHSTERVSSSGNTTVPRALSGQTTHDNIDYSLLFDRALHSNNLNELHGSQHSSAEDADNSFENFLKRSVYSERNMYEHSSASAFKNGDDKGTSEELPPPCSVDAEPPPPMFKDDSDPHLLEETSYHGYSLPGPDNPLQDTEDIDPTTSDYNLAKLGEYDPPSYRVTAPQHPWHGQRGGRY